MRKFLIILLFVQGCAWFSEKPFHKTVVLPEIVINIRNDCDGGMGRAGDGGVERGEV